MTVILPGNAYRYGGQGVTQLFWIIPRLWIPTEVATMWLPKTCRNDRVWLVVMLAGSACLAIGQAGIQCFRDDAPSDWRSWINYERHSGMTVGDNRKSSRV